MSKFITRSINQYIPFLFAGGLVGVTILSGLILSSPASHADSSGAVTLSVDVPALCSLTVTPGQHSATIEHGHSDDIGTSIVKSICNDPSGLAVYAVGYTGDNYGENRLIATVNNNSYYINSNATPSGTPSQSEWNMRLASVNGDYAPTIVTGFDSAHTVPTTYTKVAYRDTMTDMGENANGAQFEATYRAYIDNSQATGTYNGKVKFLLIHPSDSPNPVSVLYYNANGGTNAPGRQTGTPGTEPGTYNFTISSSIPKKFESVFLGWSEDPEATTATYQPEQAITTGKPLTLYAVWRQADVTDLDIGSTVNRKLKRLAGNSSATSGTQDTAITAIVRSNTLPNGFTATSDNTISTSTSTIPVYAWFNNGTIYYYSAADIVYLNPRSEYMFYEMRGLSDSSGIHSLDASKVTYMNYMFYSTGRSVSTFSFDLSGWDTSNVKNMSYTFANAGYSATTFSLNLFSWDISQVESIDSMFSNAGHDATTWSINNISGWNASKITSMKDLFSFAGYSATTFSLDLSDWNTSHVTDMRLMFSVAGYSATTFSLNLSGWDTSNVEDMSSMFGSAGRNAPTWSITGISSWDTSKVTNMSIMFSQAGMSATTFSFDLSSWDTSKVTDMNNIFFNAGRSATTFSLNLSGWDTSKVTNMTSMFSNAGMSATTWSITIPQTNGGGISNATNRLYGQTTSIYGAPRSGKTFTIAQ